MIFNNMLRNTLANDSTPELKTKIINWIIHGDDKA